MVQVDNRDRATRHQDWADLRSHSWAVVAIRAAVDSSTVLARLPDMVVAAVAD